MCFKLVIYACWINVVIFHRSQVLDMFQKYFELPIKLKMTITQLSIVDMVTYVDKVILR